MRQYVFLNFFACRLRWRREGSRWIGFFPSFDSDLFGFWLKPFWLGMTS